MDDEATIARVFFVNEASKAFSVSGLEISGNKLSLSSSTSAAAVILSLTNIVNRTVSDNSIQ